MVFLFGVLLFCCLLESESEPCEPEVLRCQMWSQSSGIFGFSQRPRLGKGLGKSEMPLL